jgi:hypothetical protein
VVETAQNRPVSSPEQPPTALRSDTILFRAFYVSVSEPISNNQWN